MSYLITYRSEMAAYQRRRRPSVWFGVNFPVTIGLKGDTGYGTFKSDYLTKQQTEPVEIEEYIVDDSVWEKVKVELPFRPEKFIELLYEGNKLNLYPNMTYSILLEKGMPEERGGMTVQYAILRDYILSEAQNMINHSREWGMRIIRSLQANIRKHGDNPKMVKGMTKEIRRVKAWGRDCLESYIMFRKMVSSVVDFGVELFLGAMNPYGFPETSRLLIWHLDIYSLVQYVSMFERIERDYFFERVFYDMMFLAKPVTYRAMSGSRRSNYIGHIFRPVGLSITALNVLDLDIAHSLDHYDDDFRVILGGIISRHKKRDRLWQLTRFFKDKGVEVSAFNSNIYNNLPYPAVKTSFISGIYDNITYITSCILSPYAMSLINYAHHETNYTISNLYALTNQETFYKYVDMMAGIPYLPEKLPYDIDKRSYHASDYMLGGPGNMLLANPEIMIEYLSLDEAVLLYPEILLNPDLYINYYRSEKRVITYDYKKHMRNRAVALLDKKYEWMGAGVDKYIHKMLSDVYKTLKLDNTVNFVELVNLVPDTRTPEEHERGRLREIAEEKRRVQDEYWDDV
tara:strand:- start:7288 stop:9000 length:1713 start_codon:yes stop_codon:yes gene_type:complete